MANPGQTDDKTTTPDGTTTTTTGQGQQTTTTTGDDKGPKPETVTLLQTEFDRIVTKARTDEKKLRYSMQEQYDAKIAEEAAARAKAEAELSALKASMQTTTPATGASSTTQTAPSTTTTTTATAPTTTTTPADKTPPMVDIADLEKRMEEKFQRSLSAVRDEAALRITMAEATAHRERVLRESGLSPEFAEFVVGDTKDQIDASLAKAKEKQDKLTQSIEARLRNENMQYVPRGGLALSDTTDGRFGPDLGNFSAHDRTRVARIRDEKEYQRVSAALDQRIMAELKRT